MNVIPIEMASDDAKAPETHESNKTLKVYEVWIASGFSVRAASRADAEAWGTKWLGSLLSSIQDLQCQNDSFNPDAPSLAVKNPARNLQEATTLALQLLALEKESEEALKRVHQLRAQLAAEADQ